MKPNLLLINALRSVASAIENDPDIYCWIDISMDQGGLLAKELGFSVYWNQPLELAKYGLNKEEDYQRISYLKNEYGEDNDDFDDPVAVSKYFRKLADKLEERRRLEEYNQENNAPVL